MNIRQYLTPGRTDWWQHPTEVKNPDTYESYKLFTRITSILRGILDILKGGFLMLTAMLLLMLGLITFPFVLDYFKSLTPLEPNAQSVREFIPVAILWVEVTWVGYIALKGTFIIAGPKQ